MTFKTAKNKIQDPYRGKNRINQTRLFKKSNVYLTGTMEIVGPNLPTALSIPYINTEKNNMQTVCN